MKLLFLTLSSQIDVTEHGIYIDLLRCFQNHGHEIYVVCPVERSKGIATVCSEDGGMHILRVRTGNITQCGLIEKGISTILIESQFKAAIKKYYSDIKFDLVLYSTPPITFAKVIEYVKKRDGAKTYLLLKDIFPQNAVDLGMMSKCGVKGLLYRYFRRKEKKLYAISDGIGCMSRANCDYVIEHNLEVDPAIVEVCPNSIEVRDLRLAEQERGVMRDKYGIPLDKRVFVYGGNLGRPQGIPFIIECMKAQGDNKDAYFLIVGSGTEYSKIEAYMKADHPKNVRLMERLPKEDYDRMIASCDVGMIFLDHRFTIPNFPSRLLSYMQAGLPVLCCTDPNTDLGKVCEAGGFGWCCESNDIDAFSACVQKALQDDLIKMSAKSFHYLKENYVVERSYKMIMK